MNKRLWLGLAFLVVLVVLVATSTTGALWRDEASVAPGTLSTGELDLELGDGTNPYVFTALSSGNLAPDGTVRAPLTLTNDGTTSMEYRLAGVITTTASAADLALVEALALTITVADSCSDVQAPDSVLYEGRMDMNAAFARRPLPSSSSEVLCLQVTLNEDASQTAASGTTQATFHFRADQVR